MGPPALTLLAAEGWCHLLAGNLRECAGWLLDSGAWNSDVLVFFSREWSSGVQGVMPIWTMRVLSILVSFSMSVSRSLSVAFLAASPSSSSSTVIASPFFFSL